MNAGISRIPQLYQQLLLEDGGVERRKGNFLSSSKEIYLKSESPIWSLTSGCRRPGESIAVELWMFVDVSSRVIMTSMATGHTLTNYGPRKSRPVAEKDYNYKGFPREPREE